jgi:hypothetical protein
MPQSLFRNELDRSELYRLTADRRMEVLLPMLYDQHRIATHCVHRDVSSISVGVGAQKMFWTHDDGTDWSTRGRAENQH